MNRITVKDLNALCDLMALELGRPNGPTYTRQGGRNVALMGKLMHAYRKGLRAAKETQS